MSDERVINTNCNPNPLNHEIPMKAYVTSLDKDINHLINQTHYINDVSKYLNYEIVDMRNLEYMLNKKASNIKVKRNELQTLHDKVTQYKEHKDTLFLQDYYTQITEDIEKIINEKVNLIKSKEEELKYREFIIDQIISMKKNNQNGIEHEDDLIENKTERCNSVNMSRNANNKNEKIPTVIKQKIIIKRKKNHSLLELVPFKNNDLINNVLLQSKEDDTPIKISQKNHHSLVEITNISCNNINDHTQAKPKEEIYEKETPKPNLEAYTQKTILNPMINKIKIIRHKTFATRRTKNDESRLSNKMLYNSFDLSTENIVKPLSNRKSFHFHLHTNSNSNNNINRKKKKENKIHSHSVEIIMKNPEDIFRQRSRKITNNKYSERNSLHEISIIKKKKRINGVQRNSNGKPTTINNNNNNNENQDNKRMGNNDKPQQQSQIPIKHKTTHFMPNYLKQIEKNKPAKRREQKVKNTVQYKSSNQLKQTTLLEPLIKVQPLSKHNPINEVLLSPLTQEMKVSNTSNGVQLINYLSCSIKENEKRLDQSITELNILLNQEPLIKNEQFNSFSSFDTKTEDDTNKSSQPISRSNTSLQQTLNQPNNQSAFPPQLNIKSIPITQLKNPPKQTAPSDHSPNRVHIPLLIQNQSYQRNPLNKIYQKPRVKSKKNPCS